MQLSLSSWSFGVLLWEIFTLGGSPYPGLAPEQLLNYLREGNRMEQPQDCPLEVYTIMTDCWMHGPDDRPRFCELVARIGKILRMNSEENDNLLTGISLRYVEEGGEFKPAESKIRKAESEVGMGDPETFTDIKKDPNSYDTVLLSNLETAI